MRRWHALAALAVLAVLGLSACLGAMDKDSRSIPQAHTICSACHAFSQETGRAGLQNNVTPDELCTGCHSDRAKAGEHRVGMPLSGVSSTLPLVDGLVACITCHEPHGLSGFPSLLRTEPATLCNRCHGK
ncbi:MAG: cytochrome c3 family protein [Thermodesulfovibrionales bacterium]|nr:cytochrome c3 family protein [Thermodesulfovibrionales bacterium]